MTVTTAPEPTVTRASTAQRVAVGSLVLWGLVHLAGGGVMIAATAGSAEDAMATYATALTVAPLDGASAEAVTALVGFHGFNIAAAGVAVGLLAWRSRRRDPGSLTAPLVIAAVADIGLVTFLLAPGVMAAGDGSPGLVLLAVAAVAAVAAGWRPAPRDRTPRRTG